MFFELVIENEDGSRNNGYDASFRSDVLEGLTPEEFYDMKVIAKIKCVEICFKNLFLLFRSKTFRVRLGAFEPT